MEVQDQRVRFVVAALTGEKPISALCAEFGISRPTGYLWIDRYREGGVSAIAERSRRPHRSPDKTADAGRIAWRTNDGRATGFSPSRMRWL